MVLPDSPLCYGEGEGFAGGGKSALGCLWIIESCQKYAGSRWLIGRSKLDTLKKTTLKTFFELASKLGIALIASNFASNIPSREKTTNPYKRMSMNIRSTLYGMVSKIPSIIEQCRRLNLDGVLDRYHVGCRAVAGDAMIIESAVKKELGIPVMLLEWENFDPRVYKHEEYTKRLEVFKAMMIANRHS